MNGNKAKPMILQPRDLEFFRILGASARIVDREQAMKFAGFSSVTRVNTRLLKLTANGFLRRYFLGTLKGGSKALYTLSPKGAVAAGVQNSRAVIRPKESLLVGDPFVQHQLNINAVHIAARYSQLTTFNSSFNSGVILAGHSAKQFHLFQTDIFQFKRPRASALHSLRLIRVQKA